MKKLFYSLMTLAAALTVTSCLKEVEGGPAAYDDGTLVDATFSVTLGPQTKAKAFADGTTVDKLYAGLYEDASPAVFVDQTTATFNANLEAQVTFNGKIKRGKSYKVVFWAQKDGGAYTPALNSATPTVTVATTGNANDEDRDAFYGTYSFGPVKGNVTVAQGDAIQLKRPFAQINILVPDTNIDNTTATTRTSSMTITGAPNVLNLLTGFASGSETYTFNSATIKEAAFGSFVSGYQYMAMNYVLPTQDGNGAYIVTFSVVNDSQSVTDKQVTIPLKPNVRTNIVGNIFDENFDFSGWAVIKPEAGELTTINLNVGDAGATADNPVTLSGAGATTSVTPIISRDVTGETPTITVDPASVATAVWNSTTKAVDITALANGTATVTVVFPAVTKTDYAEGKLTFFISVTGVVAQQVAAPTFTPAAGEYTEAQNVEIACATEGATIHYTTDGSDPTAASTAYTAAIAVGETMTIKAIAVKEGMTDSEIATAAYTINIPAEPDFTTIAGLKDLLGAESDTFTGTLTDAVVSFIAGTSDAVIKDATGSILYHKETGHNLLQGQTISGDVIVDAVLYNGINEITDLAATVEGTGSAVEPQVVTLAQLAADYATYESAYVKVVGVTSKTTTTAKGDISVTQDATDYIVYTNVAIPVNTGDIFTAEGTVTKYNSTEEIKVWKSADLTVTTEAPILSATPATKTVNSDVTSVTWNITSNTDWTITPGTGVTPSATSGNGNAEVTLSFAANKNTNAATYTATVSAAGCEDVTITITQSGAKTYTLVINAASLGDGAGSATQGYGKYNGSYNLTATAADDSQMTVSITTYQVMPNSGNLQFQANAGLIYNTTDLGTVNSINAGTDLTTVIGSSENPSSAENGGYFSIAKTSKGAASIETITITFTK